jgi:hypothetical protein
MESPHKKRERKRKKNLRNPPGGSTAIRGRQPTVQASGFMVTNVDLSPPTPNASAQPTNSPTPLPVPPSQARPLVPRAAWMLEDDDRTDEQADADWRRACDSLFGSHAAPHDERTSSSTVTAVSDNRQEVVLRRGVRLRAPCSFPN